MNYPLSKRQLQISPPKHQIIQLQNYPKYVVNVEFDHERYTAIEREFKMLDQDNSGALSREELVAYIRKKLGPNYSARLVDEMFNEINQDQDNMISKDEFSHGYITKELNLKHQIEDITKSIFELEERSRLLQKELLEVSNDVGLVIITILSGTILIDKSVSNAERTQSQVIVTMSTEDSINTKKQKDTKPSLSYEHPLWNETLQFYIKQDQSSIQFTIEVLKYYQQRKTQLHKNKFIKMLNNNTQQNDKISLDEIGEIDITFEYFNSFVNWSKQKQNQISQDLRLKYDQGVLLKQKQSYYKILFGTIPSDNIDVLEVMRNTVKALPQVVMYENIQPFQIQFDSMLPRPIQRNEFPSYHQPTYQNQNQSSQQPIYQNNTIERSQVDVEVSYSKFQDEFNLNSMFQPKIDKKLQSQQQAQAQPQPQLQPQPKPQPQSPIQTQSQSQPQPKTNTDITFTNFSLQPVVYTSQDIAYNSVFLSQFINKYIDTRKLMTYILFVMVIASCLFRANYIPLMVVLFLLPNLHHKWNLQYVYQLVYGFGFSIVLDGLWYHNHLQYEGQFCSLIAIIKLTSLNVMRSMGLILLLIFCRYFVCAQK